MGALTNSLKEYDYQVKIETAGADEGKIKISRETGTFNLLQADREIIYEGQLAEGTYTFDSFPIELQIIWFNTLYGKGVGTDGANFDDQEFRFLIQNSETEDGFEDRIIEDLFKALIDKKDITEVEREVFIKFQNKAPESLSKELRIKLVKQYQGSDYIADTYPGLVGFTLKDFASVVGQTIGNFIENDQTGTARRVPTITYGIGVKFEYRDNTIEIPIRAYEATTQSVRDRLDASDFSLFPEDRDDVRKALSQPLKYVDFELEGLDKLEFITKEEGSLWDFFKDKPFNIDDVLLDHYLRFVDNVQLGRQDTNTLNRQLEDLRNEQANQSVELIIPFLLRHYEALVRVEIAKLLVGLPAGEIKAKKNELMNDAEKNAIDAIRGLATSSRYEEELSEETIKQRQKNYKQCVLLLNLEDLKTDFDKKLKSDSSLKKSEEEYLDPLHREGYYNNRFYMVQAGDQTNPDQNRIINKLKLPKAEQVRSFLNMTPDIHAALMPKVRLFKVYFNKENKKYITHEFPFPSSNSKDRINKLFENSTSIDRGEGLGIKEFSFSFDGETPATATKYVRAKLTLFFQSFQDFVKERTVVDGDKTFTFRYLDLFVNTKFCPRSGENSFSPLYYDPTFYRLRADVGWAGRNDEEFRNILSKRGLKSEDFNNALALTNKTFYLNLVDHNVDIANDGTVTVTADYVAYIEGVLDSNRMNALVDREVKKVQEKYVKEFEESLINPNKACDEEGRRRLKNAINALDGGAVENTRQRLVRDLILHNKLYTVNIDKPSLNQFRRREFFTKTPRIQRKEKIKSAPAEGIPDNKGIDETWSFIDSKFVQDADYQNNSKIYFFYFADLVYFLAECMYDEQGNQLPEVENVKLILSSFVITDPFKGDQLINIGQIPVDLETFTEWYDEHITKKEIDNLSVIAFIKRFMFYLVSNVFNESCINQDLIKRLMFQTTNILAVKGDYDAMDPMWDLEGPIIDVDTSYSNGLLPLKTAVEGSGTTDVRNLVSYLVVFPYYRQANHSGRGVRSIDESNGVYHFDIGAKQGLVKTVSFSRTEIDGLRESRMFTQGANSLLQLSSVYRCSMKMIGNTLLYPGMEFWLNPFGIGGLEFGFPQTGVGTENAPNLSNIMGIGGYQQVLKVTSTISSGKFETDVEAHYVYSGEEGGVTNKKEKVISVCENITNIDAGDEQTNSCSGLIVKVQNDIAALAATGEGVPDITDPEAEQETSERQ